MNINMVTKMYNKWCQFYYSNRKAAAAIVAFVVTFTFGATMLIAGSFGGFAALVTAVAWIVFGMLYGIMN